MPYSSGLSTPFFLEFQKDLDDGFIIRTTFELDKNIESQITRNEMDLTYIELDSLILPMNISMIKSHPLISLYKVIFYDGLSKPFFLDAITALISSMSIVIGKWTKKVSTSWLNQITEWKQKNIVYHLRTVVLFCFVLNWYELVRSKHRNSNHQE